MFLILPMYFNLIFCCQTPRDIEACSQSGHYTISLNLNDGNSGVWSPTESCQLQAYCVIIGCNWLGYIHILIKGFSSYRLAEAMAVLKNSKKKNSSQL